MLEPRLKLLKFGLRCCRFVKSSELLFIEKKRIIFVASLMIKFFSSKDLLPQPKYKVLWLDELNHELKDELKDELIEKEAEKTNVTSR